MSKIFILGFDGHYPRGGMLDLLTTLCNDDMPSGEDVISSEYVIKSAVLAKVVSRFTPFEHYQVVHLNMYGGILMVEHWKKAPFFALPSQAELASGAIFENAKGDYVRREGIQSECETSVNYIPGG